MYYLVSESKFGIEGSIAGKVHVAFNYIKFFNALSALKRYVDAKHKSKVLWRKVAEGLDSTNSDINIYKIRKIIAEDMEGGVNER